MSLVFETLYLKLEDMEKCGFKMYDAKEMFSI
jgi:hypothetical protein